MIQTVVAVKALIMPRHEQMSFLCFFSYVFLEAFTSNGHSKAVQKELFQLFNDPSKQHFVAFGSFTHPMRVVR